MDAQGWAIFGLAIAVPLVAWYAYWFGRITEVQDELKRLHATQPRRAKE